MVPLGAGKESLDHWVLEHRALRIPSLHHSMLHLTGIATACLQRTHLMALVVLSALVRGHRARRERARESGGSCRDGGAIPGAHPRAESERRPDRLQRSPPRGRPERPEPRSRVSDAASGVPRFGESAIGLPITVAASSIAPDTEPHTEDPTKLTYRNQGVPPRGNNRASPFELSGRSNCRRLGRAGEEEGKGHLARPSRRGATPEARRRQ